MDGIKFTGNERADQAYRKGYTEGFNTAVLCYFDALKMGEPQDQTVLRLREYCKDKLGAWAGDPYGHTTTPPELPFVWRMHTKIANNYFRGVKNGK